MWSKYICGLHTYTHMHVRNKRIENLMRDYPKHSGSIYLRNFFSEHGYHSTNNHAKRGCGHVLLANMLWDDVIRTHDYDMVTYQTVNKRGNLPCAAACIRSRLLIHAVGMYGLHLSTQACLLHRPARTAEFRACQIMHNDTLMTLIHATKHGRTFSSLVAIFKVPPEK